MGLVAEKIIMLLVSMITPELIKGAEVEFIAFLRAAASKSSNVLFPSLVELLAKSLGVP